MNSVKYIFLLLLFQLLLTSCEQEYHIAATDIESKLVVNGLFENDQPWHIAISRSYSILHEINDDLTIMDAEVKLYDADYQYLYDLVPNSEGIYTHDHYTPKFNTVYHLTVEKDGFEKLEAKGYCPEIPNIKLGNSQEIYEDGQTVVKLDFQIEQEEATDNFYIWEVKENRKDNELIHGMVLSDIMSSSGIFYDDLIDVTYDASHSHNSTFSIASQLYKIGSSVNDPNGYNTIENIEHGSISINDNGSIIIDTGAPVYGNGVPNTNKENSQRPNKFKLQVVSISRDLYLHTLSLSENTKQGHPNSNSFHQSIHSNIDGGLGVFAGITQHSVGFK